MDKYLGYNNEDCDEVEWQMYYAYLLRKVQTRLSESYNFLLDRLFKTEFYALDDMDRNREVDALDLRSDYISERAKELKGTELEDQLPDILAGPPTLLEVLIALAYRMERDVMQNEKFGDRSKEWFWAMLTNAELTDYSDRIMDLTQEQYLIKAIDNILDRRYSATGQGGFFPLWADDASKHTMNEEDLWSQAMAWLSENYSHE